MRTLTSPRQGTILRQPQNLDHKRTVPTYCFALLWPFDILKVGELFVRLSIICLFVWRGNTRSFRRCRGQRWSRMMMMHNRRCCLLRTEATLPLCETKATLTWLAGLAQGVWCRRMDGPRCSLPAAEAGNADVVQQQTSATQSLLR